MPPPFDQIKFSQRGTILGKEIYMTRKLDKEVAARIQKSTNSWGNVSQKIFRNKAFSRKIKIMISNSLIRSTAIYGLHTRDMPKHLMGNGSLYVQTNKDDDPPELEERSIVPGEKPTIPRTTTIGDGIMARRNTNYDNADTDARQPNDTSNELQRDDHAKNQATTTIEETKSCHDRTNEHKKIRNKGATIQPTCQENGAN